MDFLFWIFLVSIKVDDDKYEDLYIYPFYRAIKSSIKTQKKNKKILLWISTKVPSLRRNLKFRGRIRHKPRNKLLLLTLLLSNPQLKLNLRLSM